MRKTNLKVISDRGWEPVRRGTVYCSPRCGGNCTWAAHQKAHKDAEALARRMGEGWEPDVWENLGWHWRVKKGVATIYGPDRHRKEYSAWLSVDGVEYTGQQVQHTCQVIECAETPEDALGIATQKMRTFERRIANSLAALLD